jgi:hypothetical protein
MASALAFQAQWRAQAISETVLLVELARVMALVLVLKMARVMALVLVLKMAQVMGMPLVVGLEMGSVPVSVPVLEIALVAV